MPSRDVGEAFEEGRSTDRLLGELIAEVRAVKHNQNNAAMELRAVGRQTAPIEGLVEQIKEVRAEQEKHHFRIAVLEADKNRREGAIGLFEWISKYWQPMIVLLGAITAMVLWANGRL